MSILSENEFINSETVIPKDGMLISKDGEDEVVLIPYNEVNVLATKQDILDILSNHNLKLDKINNIEHFHEAFTLNLT